MNTLYDVLEVSEKASQEVIEKTYKVLVKKYHPDLQPPEKRAVAEKKMKEINEAYDILGNETKRKQYDEELARSRKIESQKYEQSNSQNNDHYKSGYNNQNINYTSYSSQNYYTNGVNQEEQRFRDMQRRKYEEELRKKQEKMEKQMQEEMKQKYQNAYYNYLRSLGYKIKEKWTWEKTKKLLLIILVLIAIIVILWLLPPTHNMMRQIYENNTGIKIIVDIVIGFVKAIVQTFIDLFKDLLQIK